MREALLGAAGDLPLACHSIIRWEGVPFRGGRLPPSPARAAAHPSRRRAVSRRVSRRPPPAGPPALPFSTPGGGRRDRLSPPGTPAPPKIRRRSARWTAHRGTDPRARASPRDAHQTLPPRDG